MHSVVAWAIGASYISYKYGYKCQMLPSPHRFIALTAFVSLASLLALLNETAGGLVAYGSLLALFLYGQSHSDQGSCDKLSPLNISTGQKSSGQPSSGTPGFGLPTRRV